MLGSWETRIHNLNISFLKYVQIHVVGHEEGKTKVRRLTMLLFIQGKKKLSTLSSKTFFMITMQWCEKGGDLSGANKGITGLFQEMENMGKG